MFRPKFRTALVFVAAAALLTSCAKPKPATDGTAEFSWSAARKTYAAGDYVRTANNLERILDAGDETAVRATPWYLVVTSGIARGYMDLAEHYAAGARINKANALAFRLKASESRAIAGRMALRFAQRVDKFRDTPLGDVPLAFTLPKGNAAAPPLLSSIAAGMQLTPEEQEAAATAAVERGVLMTACLAAGAPNDVAKAEAILARPSASVTRSAFGTALAVTLKFEAALFARDKLDEPDKLAAFQKRAELALAEAARVGSARVATVVDSGSEASLR